ncbi:electron transfer flavoprotein subunit alpha/FixB family protein [Paralcaligenes ureilyticus]|uniref:Electron transfer flavoprotein alpha subunit apoprotein n=1 Tax=Paralcaligenes ureilyticus TaxID=627131 RepID=A0A4R3MCR3_9BURK|nr:electron transfer flavoprotein subunit alpha/FixB family protein [Paralcaligenes ureilyticus]TCT10922.1 electron transfer flavoprotein alpha subunit apoprotein [Paralcaligenes ureilyticus]
MNPPRRINPRRPFIVTGQGRRRYTLGQTAVAGGEMIQAVIPAVGPGAAKPLRLTGEAQRCIMTVTHSERGVLSLEAQQAVAAAALLADAHCAVLLIVFGPLNEDTALLGADQLIVMPDADVYEPDVNTHILGGLIEQFAPTHIVMADNDLPDGDLGRRVAAQYTLGIATHVVELTANAVTVYQQQGAVYARQPLPRVILLDHDCVDMRLPFSGQGKEMTWTRPAADLTPRYRDRGTTTVPAQHLSLEEADFIISAGNGVQDLNGFHALADAFGAAIGASRVAVDDGRFTRDQQVGATGKTVASSVYIALGISGAVQHLQGIKDCRHVIAVNIDASAPMVKRADFSVIDDTQALARALCDEIHLARHQHTEPRP